MAKEVVIEFQTKGVGDAIKSAKKYNETLEDTIELVDDLDGSFDGVINQQDRLGKSLGKTNKEVGGISKSGKKGAGGLKAIGQGLGKIGISLSPLTVVIALVGALTTILKEQQPVIDFLDTTMNGLSIAIREVSEAVSAAFNASSKLNGGFNATIAVVKGLFKIAITPLQLKFLILKEALLGAQLLWEKSFLGKGDDETIKQLQIDMFNTAMAIKDLGVEAFNAGKDIVTNIVEAGEEIFEFGEKVVENVEKIDVAEGLAEAKRITRLKNAEKLRVAQNEKLLEEFDIRAEKLRQERDNINLTFEERQKASKDLADVLKEQEELMVQNANIAVQSAKAQLATNKGNIDLQVALINAEKERAAVIATVTGLKTEQGEQDRALAVEQIESLNAEIDKEVELSQIQEESEMQKVQNVIEANKLKLKNYEKAGATEVQGYKDTVAALELAEEEKKKLVKENTEEAIKIVNQLTMERIDLEIEALKNAEEEKKQLLIETGMDTQEALIALEEETNMKIKELNQKQLEERISNAQNVLKGFGDVVAQIDALISQNIENRRAELEANAEERQMKLDESSANEIATLEARAEEEKRISGEVSIKTQNDIIRANNKKLEDQFRLDTELFKSRQEADKRDNEAKKKAFRVNQAFAIANTILNTAGAISKYLFDPGGLLGGALSVAAGITGGLQLATIKATKFKAENTAGTAPKAPNLADLVSSSTTDIGNAAGGSGASGGLSTNTQFVKQQLFAVGSEGVGGEAGKNQIRVAVVESDITNTQNRVKTIESQAEFGD